MVYDPNEADLLYALMDNIKDNIYFKDLESRFIMVNKSFCEWTGIKAEEVIGKTDFDLFTEEHGEEAFHDEQRIMKTGTSIVGKEEKETWPDGHETWVSTTKMPLHDSAGNIVGTFGISRDITAQMRARMREAKYADQTRRLSEEMESELHMAAELQHAFLPTNIYPTFPKGVPVEKSAARFWHHYYSTSAVGGDFCSVRKLSDTEVGILMCDVMGHGVRAAIVTALVRAIVEEISYKKKDPAQFLQHMNKALKPMIQKEGVFLFSTACYLVLDVSTGTIRYANAGHPTPILLNTVDNMAEWLVDDPAAAGPALAIVPDIEYRTFERTLHPHDAVIMYTDGLYEVENAKHEELGPEGLLAVVHKHRNLLLHDIFPNLISDIRRYAARHKFGDDVCLIGCRFAHPLDTNAKG